MDDLPNLPKDWKTDDLRNYLTSEELAYLTEVWYEKGGDQMDFMDAVKHFFREPELAARLTSKGVDPTFASYSFPFWFHRAMEAAQAADTDDLVSRIMGQHKPIDPMVN